VKKIIRDTIRVMMSLRSNKYIIYKQKGFTIVELLIVIVVIAILAAISIAAYTGIQNRAYDNTVQQDLRNIAQKIEMYRIASPNDQYPVGPTQLADAEVTASRDAYGNHYNNGSGLYNLVYCRLTSAADRFALVGRSKSGAIFQYTSGGGIAEFTGNWNNGSASICSGAGVANGGVSSARDWFFNNSEWQTFVK